MFKLRLLRSRAAHAPLIAYLSRSHADQQDVLQSLAQIASLHLVAWIAASSDAATAGTILAINRRSRPAP